MSKGRIFSKLSWQIAVGINKKPKRLKLLANKDGLFTCPVSTCESEYFKSQRGCRKHVFYKHGWYYFFEEKPDINKYFPYVNVRNMELTKQRRSVTSSMPMFLKTCKVSTSFSRWLQSPGGGGKSLCQAEQITCRVLKFAKFCCNDVLSSWDIPDSVMDYCIGSVNLISEFVEHLQNYWHVRHSGVIGYVQAIHHFLDFRRSLGMETENISVFVASEIYLDRVRKCLTKQMKVEWNTVLSVDYLSSINCWATLDDLQKVIPFHADKFTQVLLNAGDEAAIIPTHDLSFATSFIVAVLFIMVKASRPMTYQYLTIKMIQNLRDGGIVDQTQFKTNYKYGFDSLIFSTECTAIINGYINCIRERLNPTCDYLLVSRSGTQLTQVSSIFGRIVFLAINKYINPTRFRQIIETESVAKLDQNEQSILSQDQKHTSRVAKVHYQKIQSRDIAEKGKQCINKLVGSTVSQTALKIVAENVLHTEGTSTTGQAQHVNTNQIKSNAAVGIQSGYDFEIMGRSKKRTFSCIEDNFIRQGISKYGCGKWTSILRDESYKFHPSRKASTIFLRAKKLNLL